ncbi:hypothetical protein K2173_020777 [Erythroxylum novogranatense]|uniref:ABC transporter domain-containing protein n=1 Tax=Erythroxylum novogranatense TaxID=1862640 RepID=A0AAV8TLW7_9ROSI|nr:hypothetical protein K2173_020777 [Erythroxylum novogranatense]
MGKDAKISDCNFENGEVNDTNSDMLNKKKAINGILKVIEVDHENFLWRLRDRLDRVGIELPKVEIRFQHLSVEGEAYVGKRALPTLINSTLNVIEDIVGMIGVSSTQKRVIEILKDLDGLIKPSRLTLVLGPPGSGKSTLLRALSGKLNSDLKVTGKVSYCGHKLSEFVPQRTCSYISHHDLHHAEMTVRETLNFSGYCLGADIRNDMLTELSKREKEQGIEPDPVITEFMKATAMADLKSSLITDYIVKMLGLDNCSDIPVGDEMRRGISGGEKKRVTTGEMLAGPARAFVMDDISTGLDSSTTFQIIKFLRQIVHIMGVTMVVSLLQPAPETFKLFDDIILLSEGQIVYQGPRESVLDFFESIGFKCPERKGVADFLQEVTSRTDQRKYWMNRDLSYRYISVPDIVQIFPSHQIGQKLSDDLGIPFDRSKLHPAALVKEKYGISNWELFKACISRELLLMKRNMFLYIFRSSQIAIMAVITLTLFPRTHMTGNKRQDALKFMGSLFFGLMIVMFNGMVEVPMMVLRLPVFFKQRDSLFFPAWAFGLPIWLLSIPISILESGIWMALTYYTIGFAPEISRFSKQFLAFFSLHQAAISLFRFMAVIGRTQVLARLLGAFTLLMVVVLGGFVVAKDDMEPWITWASYISPLTYGQNAISINEFLDERWGDPAGGEFSIGMILLKERGLFHEQFWYWGSIGILLGFSVFFSISFIAGLTFLKFLGNSKAVLLDNDTKKHTKQHLSPNSKVRHAEDGPASIDGVPNRRQKGMVLPFQPLSLAFNHVNYYVDMPKKMKNQENGKKRLQLLHDVSGAFRPGILTALVGVSGAGKTTLMDVLSGRKTSGKIEGSINVSGHPKNQTTFVRVCSYCEQNDVHSPYITVFESILYSAWLRLSAEVNGGTRQMFVEEVMELVELDKLRNALVGLPGVDGLSTEQRKRLTIAVELVANPSIIFMDEPTSGLDARAAAVVMRTVRNTVDTGRTVVCTIHQPSIDVFEAFDELLLMKRGGKLIYAGPLGFHSRELIEYFEAIPGIPKIKEGYNPATWMLEISTKAVETQLGVDLAEVYARSDLCRRNQQLIEELSIPQSSSKDLHFSSQYSQSFINQCKACFWKQHLSYWRNSEYNAIRFFVTIVVGILFGLVFWNKGAKLENPQDVINFLGATYASILLVGALNADSVQPVVVLERTVFYRERAAGMYSAFPYAFAQVAIEIIYVSIQTLIYSIPLYYFMGFHWKVDRFFYFYYFIFICFSYFSLYGMMVVSLTPSVQIAAIVMAFFVSIWNLFCGFFIPWPMIPNWWRWYYWCNPISWTIYGIVTSQVGDSQQLLQIPGFGDVPLVLFLKAYFGYDYQFLHTVVIANAFWLLLFSLIFALGIKFFNFQKR